MKASHRRSNAGRYAGLLIVGLAAVARGQESQPAADEARWFRNVRQVTSAELGLARSGEAYFSPDGKRICFQAYPTGKEDYQIYVMNLDGTGLKMVSTGEGATTCSYFHPSGEKLLFASNHADQRPPVAPAEFETHRPRAGEQPKEAEHGGEPAKGSTQPTSQPSHGRSYAWKYYPGMQIYEYTFATGALKRLTHSDAYDAEGSYSPDGKQIVFCSLRDGNPAIYICDADGQNPRRVTHDNGRDGGPFYSPDGKRILYRGDRTGEGNLQVFVNNLEGTAEKTLTPPDAFHWCPYWHPSGKWIIFTHANFKQDANFDLYLMRDDGSDLHRVTSNPGFDGLPVFSPDGRYLMWTSTRNGISAPQIFIAEFVGLTPAGELQVKD
jgi:Tol biopolymer transport system component